MSLRQKYGKWSSFQQNLFILICVALVGTLACAGFIFLDNVGVLLGWLLGSSINILSYVTIYKGSSFLLDPSARSSKLSYLASIFSILRIFLYAGALLLAGFATFRWGTISHGYCNFVSTALALMPTWIVVFITTINSVRAPKKQPEVKEEPKVEDKPEEKGDE